MAIYYLITSAMIANLLARYCSDKEDQTNTECTDDENKFSLFPVLGFFIMIMWVSFVSQNTEV